MPTGTRSTGSARSAPRRGARGRRRPDPCATEVDVDLGIPALSNEDVGLRVIPDGRARTAGRRPTAFSVEITG